MSLFTAQLLNKNALCALSILIATIGLGYSQALLAQPDTASLNQAHSSHYACPMHPEETSHEPGRCAICKMFLVKDDSQATDTPATVSNHYYCPMHPEETSHEPGRCAICKMFLVKDDSQATDTPATVSNHYYCPMHPEETSHEPGRCAICKMFLVKDDNQDEPVGHSHTSEPTGATNTATQSKAERLLSQPLPTLTVPSNNANVKYVCPMHPNVVTDTPSTCPICGMNLEQVTVGVTTAEVVVNVSGAMQQALGVRSEQVTQGSLGKQVQTIGTVQYNENAIAHAHTRVNGWIETLMVHTIGQRVKQGQLLYELYSPELINAQDDYMQAVDYLKQDNKRGASLLRKARLRLELLGVSTATIKQLERTGETIYRVPYYAEQDGFISQLSVRHGMYVQPGDTLFEIVDLSSVWVIADVFENEQSWLEPGRPVEVASAAQGLFDLASTVDYIYPELDPVSRAMRVRIKLENTERKLKPGTLVDVTLFGGVKDNILTIPTEALILTGRENRVVVQRSDQQFAAVTVKVGMISQGRAEITQGLNAGDKVIVSGQFLIDSEASIQGSLQRLNSSKVSPQPHANH
ncbi:efflux RND transporter periplasmic adaptor subunit [Shewanella youngdeokensis]|uniref:Efflux RND transporter periplasmic adaptor subunit n=1 Tax=Shewanella youngdeokensis TaxID=2999068 RepID=A0ABZ0K0R0_9GAMM|nr:efflux RND transporter periplasmic adaptor subunit [Shewanella sp. DAU334]